MKKGLNVSTSSLDSRIGLLTQRNHPLLPFWLASIRSSRVGSLYILTDQKNWSTENDQLFQQRTNGYFSLQKHPQVTPLSETRDPFIPIYLTSDHNSTHCTDLIKDLKIDLLINCGTPRKLRAKTLSSTPIGVLNVHPGILPKYRGSSAVEWAIFNEDPVGNTAHFMNEEYDAGNIIMTREVNSSETQCYQDIRILVYEEGMRLMVEAIEKIFKEGLTSQNTRPQNDQEACVWPPIGRDDFNLVLEKAGSSEARHDGSH